MAEYELLQAQRNFLEIPHDIKTDVALYQGGYGSGKTFCGALLGIMLCQKYAGIRGLVGAQTLPLIRDTTLVMYLEHLDKMEFKEDKHYVYKRSENKIIFSNGSEIMFRSFDDETKIKSLNLGFVEIEEMSDTKEGTFRMLLGRLRQEIKPEWAEKNFKYRLFGHTNPEPDKGWLYKTFVKNNKVNYRRILAPSTENKFLDASFLENLKDAYDPEYYRINVLGEDGDYTSGLVVKGWCDANIKQINYNRNLPVHITCDFNISPNCWQLAHKTTEKVFFFDEFCYDMPTDQQIKVVMDKYKDHNAAIIINGDASGDSGKSCSGFTDYKLIQNELIKRGYHQADQSHKDGKTFRFDLRAANGSKMQRFYSFNAKVKNAKNEICIFADPKCKWLIYNCENLKIIQGTSEFDVPSASKIKNDNNLKYLGHAYDSASYLINYYWAIKQNFNKRDTLKEKYISQYNFDHIKGA
jgi:hypothetical protein